MKITEKIKQVFNRKSVGYDRSEWIDLMRFLGVDNEDTSSLSEATYYACIKVLSESIGKLPLRLLQYNDRNGKSKALKHPLYKILHDRPNPYMTATTFWSTVEFNRNHYGNAYVWIRGAGKNTNLWILPSSQVEVWYDDAKILANVPDVYYLYSAGGKIYKLGSEEVLHFKSSNSIDGVVGISVQDQLRLTIQGNAKAQKLINKMYDSGFTAKAVLQYTGSLSDDNVKAFVKGIESYAKGDLKSQGIENIIPIPVGANLQPLNVKLADNQFVEVKQYSALQIASAFGIKPYQIGDYTKSSYASAEAQQLSFYVDTLLYIIKQYEEEITYKLLTTEEVDNGLHAKFNVAVILRADLKTQIETLSQAVNSFIYKPNEAREFLDMEWTEGGDVLLGNGASIPVQYTGAQYTQLENGQVLESEEEQADATPNDIVTIVENIHDGTLTYDQALAIVTITLGYDNETARQLLGDPSDYENNEPQEPETTDPTNEENTDDDPNDDPSTGDDPNNDTEEMTDPDDPEPTNDEDH